MLPLRETLFALLMGLPAHRLDNEEAGARQNRMHVIAEAIADASQRATCSGIYSSSECVPIWPLGSSELSALLLTEAYSESRLARNVHEGKCRAWECDPVRSAYTGQVRHRARSIWQIQRSSHVEAEWDQMLGADQASTSIAAWAAAKLLTRGYRSCGSIGGAISRYAGIDGCNWSESEKRVRFYKSLRERIRRAEQRQKDESQQPQAMQSTPGTALAARH